MDSRREMDDRPSLIAIKLDELGFEFDYENCVRLAQVLSDRFEDAAAVEAEALKLGLTRSTAYIS
jgi:hypothetical protein